MTLNSLLDVQPNSTLRHAHGSALNGRVVVRSKGRGGSRLNFERGYPPPRLGGCSGFPGFQFPETLNVAPTPLCAVMTEVCTYK